MWWYWNDDKEFHEVVFEFTIHTDPGNFSRQHGLYLMVCSGTISGHGFYFGLQTDVYDPSQGLGRGKGLIFSRWDERDLAFAKVADGDDSWSQSSGHEGDFIGVRRAYNWGVGDYRMRIAPDGKDEDGEWYGVWVTDVNAIETTWAGSLKFPYIDGKTTVMSPVYTTIEIYGRAIRPIDIPQWHVTMKRPQGDRVNADSGSPSYSAFYGEIMNSDVQYIGEAVHFRLGGTTERVGHVEPMRFR